MHHRRKGGPRVLYRHFEQAAKTWSICSERTIRTYSNICRLLLPNSLNVRSLNQADFAGSSVAQTSPSTGKISSPLWQMNRKANQRMGLTINFAYTVQNRHPATEPLTNFESNMFCASFHLVCTVPTESGARTWVSRRHNSCTRICVNNKQIQTVNELLMLFWALYFSTKCGT